MHLGRWILYRWLGAVLLGAQLLSVIPAQASPLAIAPTPTNAPSPTRVAPPTTPKAVPTESRAPSTARPSPTAAGTPTRASSATGPKAPAGALLSPGGGTAGYAVAWGNGTHGQLGDCTTYAHTWPQTVENGSGQALSEIVQVGSGTFASLFLTVDGNVWTAGNGAGCVSQVPGVGGTGTLGNVAALGLSDPSVGDTFSLALTNDGTVLAWGANSCGELGMGDTTTRANPTAIGALSQVQAIAIGTCFSLALKSDGTVWAWGANDHGEIGKDTGNCGGQYQFIACNQLTPIQIASLGTDNTQLTAGANWGVVTKRDGSVWAWGNDTDGELGNGTTNPNQNFTPTRVQGLSAPLVLSANPVGDHTLALASDHTLWAWGDNSAGQLGDGTTQNRDVPVPVVLANNQGPLSNVVTVSAGAGFSLASRLDGTVWGWGSDSVYQLGCLNGGPANPAQIGGCGGYPMPPATGVVAGNITSYALGVALPRQPAPAGSVCYKPLKAFCGGPGGDPVQPLSGNYTYTHSDLAIAGRGPSPSFVRSYNSGDSRVTALGPGWTTNFTIRLNDPGDGSGDVILVGPAGRSDLFTPGPTGVYLPPAAVATTLARNPDGTYTATLADQTVWRFSPDGRLTSIADRDGNTSTLTYNANLQLVSVSDPAGRGSLTFSDNPNGTLASVTDWLSPARTVRFGYDSSGRLSTVTDRTGQVTTYGYDGTTSHLTTITDANNHVALTNTYDSQGRVSTQKDALGLTTGQQTTFSYVTNGDGSQTTTITYPQTSFDGFAPQVVDTFNPQGQLTQTVTRPSSAESSTESFGYDANGNLTLHTDARGNTTTSCYDVGYSGAAVPGSLGNLTRVIAPPPTTGGNPLVTLFKYDGKNNLVETIPPKGVNNGATVTCATNLSGAINATYATDDTYDANVIDLLAVTEKYADPDLGAQTAITKFEYGDANNPGLVTRIIPPRGNTGPNPDYSYATTFVYNASGSQAGMLASTTDPLGDETTYTYDAVGRRLTMVDPDGNVSGGNPSAHTWTYSYDNEDRLLSLQAPAPTTGGSPLTTSYTYDPVGNRTVVIDANGQVTKYRYDVRDSLAEVDQSPSVWQHPVLTPTPEYATTYAYDNLGNLARVTRDQGDSSGERATDYTYDGLNRLRTETQYPNWPTTTPTLVTSYTYDGNGNRLTLRDPLAQTTTYGYDPLNRLTSISFSDGVTPNVTYGYDANGNRTAMTDGTGTTSYTYDELDRLLSVNSPGSKTVGYRYDLDGNRTKLIYPDNTAVTYTFDKGSRLESLLDWANRTTSYQYLPDGSLQTTTNVDGTTASYSYDNAQRLTRVLNQNGTTIIDQHAYTLDNLGNRTALSETLAQLSGGALANKVTLTYDRLSRLTGAATTSQVLPPLAGDATIETNVDNAPQGEAEAFVTTATTTGTATQLSLYLDASSTATAVQVGLYADDGANDPGSLLAQATLSAPVPGAWNTVAIPATALSAGTNYWIAVLAPNGDGTVVFRDVTSGGKAEASAQTGLSSLPTTWAGSTVFANAPLSAYLTVAGGPPTTTTYTYDRADRILSAGPLTDTVNANGNLTNRGSDVFAYDQANRLTSATVSGVTSTDSYDGDGKRASQTVGSATINYVYDVNGSLPNVLTDGTNKYVYGLGLGYAVDTSGNVQVYHTDGLGSVRAITNGSGTLIQNYQTDEFGIPTSSQGTSTQPFGYTGQQVDGNGLVYLRARFYDPTSGRFLGRDPLFGTVARPQSLNRFSYGENNPTSGFDPSGMVNEVLGDSYRGALLGIAANASAGAADNECTSTGGGSFGGEIVNALGCLDMGALTQVPVVVVTSDGAYFSVAFATAGNPPTGGGQGAGSTKTSRIAQHLRQSDLSAAARELLGEIVARKPDGTPFDHVQEVREAQSGLLSRIRQISNQLGRASLTDEARMALRDELGQASRLLDYSERYVPR